MVDDERGFVDHYARQLTPDEREKLHRDSVVISDFKRAKMEQEAKKNWDLFYKRNTTHFFRDRHWITREFPELLEAISELEYSHDGMGRKEGRGGGPLGCGGGCGDGGSGRKVLLEAGCGVGNTVFPLIGEIKDLFVHACDFSPRAIELFKAHPQFHEDSCHAFVCDLTEKDSLSAAISPDSVNMASLFFVLSAISPQKMPQVLSNVYNVLRPGGLLLLRDYGLYDHAQLRFSRGHKIEENFYFRQDGTRAYYFSVEKVATLAVEAGYEVTLNEYVQKETVNHKEELCVPRIFVQAKLRKPSSTTVDSPSPPNAQSQSSP